jgi:hypothetical protein
MNQSNAQHYRSGLIPEMPGGAQSSWSGKQRSRMNAFKHNLTGNNLILQEHEYQKYTELSEKLMEDLKPRTKFERQIAQKIIDTNFRLNRLAAIENNMLNFDMIHRETDGCPCDRTEVMLAQTRAWKDDARTFDILGRYESRLTRQLVLYRKELAELQAIPLPEPEQAMTAAAPSMKTRLSAASSPRSVQATNSNDLNPKLASFGNSRFETLPPLPPPISLKHRQAA